ncbi:MAG: DNA replication protein DnaD, partial [Gorillibacterium sp.]|nr:DNA replication protein DnaD [Gorillibacterium sp.]
MRVKKQNLIVLAEGLQAGLRSGSVNVSHLFLTSYARMGLSETEAMLLIHLMTFIEKENKGFPTLDEIR